MRQGTSALMPPRYARSTAGPGLALAFLPFAVIALLHLIAIATGSVWEQPTKILLMPALLLVLLPRMPRLRAVVAILLAVAIGLSWMGDVLIADPGGVGFFLGLGSFLLAHLAYLALFRWPLSTRRPGWWAFAYLAWWMALLLVLGPHLGVLFVAVAVYGLVLGAGGVYAMAANPLSGVGALAFMASDSILAMRMFYPGFELWQQNTIIMALYCIGQALIVAGALRQGTRPPRTAGPVLPAAAA